MLHCRFFKCNYSIILYLWIVSLISSSVIYRLVYIKALSQNQEENGDESDGASGDDDSGTDHVNCTITRTQLQRCEHRRGADSTLPDVFQTNHLLFYERFKALQDYMLGNARLTIYIIFPCRNSWVMGFFLGGGTWNTFSGHHRHFMTLNASPVYAKKTNSGV